MHTALTAFFALIFSFCHAQSVHRSLAATFQSSRPAESLLLDRPTSRYDLSSTDTVFTPTPSYAVSACSQCATNINYTVR